MLDTFPPSQTGGAMAMFGMGVMLGPILGPSLGAYLTEYYNWRWVFFINVPLGAIALLGIQAAIKDPPHRAIVNLGRRWTRPRRIRAAQTIAIGFDAS